MLRILEKRQTKRLNRKLIDDDFRRAYSVHSITLSELQDAITDTEIRYNELIEFIEGQMQIKGC